jgi:hypothetical protein
LKYSEKCPVTPSTSETAILATTEITSGAISILPKFEFE